MSNLSSDSKINEMCNAMLKSGRWSLSRHSKHPIIRHLAEGATKFFIVPCTPSDPRAYANYRGGRHFRPGGPGGPRPGGPGRVGPGPRPGGPNRVAPGPRGNGPRDGRPAPPRSNNFNGPAPRPNEMRGRTTPNGMVQRVGGSSRTTVTTRPNNNQRPPQAQRPQQGQRPQQAQRPQQGQRPQGQRPPQGQRQQPPRR